ncbi:hypothetical protein HA402_000091 [Bradysia odoriphaga]|nr:hypothetical protein HA402_000091 [Bradysia odoriphaga]
MRILITSLLIILTIISESFCFDLKCDETDILDPDSWRPTVGCVVSGLVITTRNDAITSVNGNADPDSMETTYTQLIIRDEKVRFIPRNIATFFPQLIELEISNSGLEWFEQANIKELTSLKTLNLDNNRIKILEKGLFDFNTELETISLKGNLLKFVHQRIFYDLSNLQTIDLENNECTAYNDYRTQYLKSSPYYYRSEVVDLTAIPMSIFARRF